MTKRMAFHDVAARCGWTPTTQVQVLLNYIDQSDSAAALEPYLQKVEQDEKHMGEDDPTYQVREWILGDEGWGLVEETVEAAIREADRHDTLTRMQILPARLKDCVTLYLGNELPEAIRSLVDHVDYEHITGVILDKLDSGEL